MSDEKRTPAAMASGIGAKAVQVAAQAENLEASIDEDRTAEAVVLEIAIEAARPALRAICRPMLMVERYATPHVGKHHRAFHAVKGLHLDGDPHARLDHAEASSGAFEGVGLVLLETGELSTRCFAGTWSKEVGATNECTSHVCTISAREAMNDWALDRCLSSIVGALEAHLTGKGPDRARKARQRAERLRALAILARIGWTE